MSQTSAPSRDSASLVLLRDGAAPTTSYGMHNVGADQLNAASFTMIGGTVQRKRLTARGKPRYRQAALQIFAPSGNLRLTRTRLEAFVDAPDIDPA